MNKVVEKLRQLGCDMDVTLERFLDDEEFYVSCFEQMLDDESFKMLGKYLDSHDIKKAFDCAHTIIGLASNMGLDSLYDIIIKIVEPLRAGSDEGLKPVYEDLLNEKQKYSSLLKK